MSHYKFKIPNAATVMDGVDVKGQCCRWGEGVGEGGGGGGHTSYGSNNSSL